MKYRPPRTVIGIPSTPLVVVFGRKAARRRAESPLARPGKGEFSGQNSSSACEVPAAAYVGTNHRKWPASMASRRTVCRVQVGRGAAVDAEGRGAVRSDEWADGAAPPAGVRFLGRRGVWLWWAVATGRGRAPVLTCCDEV